MMEFRRLRLVRTAAVVVGAAALLMTTAATTAVAAGAVAPPGPVRELTLTAADGGGNRGLAFDAHWTPPQDQGGGIRTHYVVEVHDDLGGRLYSGAVGTTVVERVAGDYCRAPFTISVRAVTQHPQTGEPLAGPPVEARFGGLNRCEINMSITARQTGPGAVEVVRHREPPVDPGVAGDCDLTLDGEVRWSGTCGGYEDRAVTVEDVAPGDHDVVLTTVSPRGDRYVATTHVTVTG